MKRIINIIILFFFLHACTGVKEAGKVLRNEKIRTTDEFLVKKKDPLILPPDYQKIPLPNTKAKKETDDIEEIKKILKAPKKQKTESIRPPTSVENSILNEIRK
jgi:hypothetical protein